MANNSNSNTKKIVKGMSSQTLVTVVSGVVEIVSFSIMSRLLTKADFGYYAAMVAVMTIFSSLSESGIGSAIIQRKDADSRYVNNAFTLSLLFGSVITVLLFLMSGVLSKLVADESMAFPLKIMSVTLLLHCLTSVNISIMYRRLQFLKVGAIHLISLVITTLIAIYLAYKGFGYYAIIAKVVSASILAFILTYIGAKQHYKLSFETRVFKQIFSFSGWLMAGSLLRNLSQQVDKLLMANLLSIEALGAYNRPKDFIANITARINSIFDTALFPVLSSIQDKLDSMRNAYKKSLYNLNLFGMLLCAGLCFNSDLFIRIFFGENWLSLKPLFQIFASYLVLNVDGRLMDCYLRSIGKTKAQFIFRSIQFILSIVFLVLGAKFGMVGVACAVVSVNLVMVLIKMAYISKFLEFTVKESILTVVQSWKFMLFLAPAMLAGMMLLPHTWGGDIVLASIYLIVVAVLFLFTPTLVGSFYKTTIYNNITKYLKRR